MRTGRIRSNVPRRGSALRLLPRARPSPPKGTSSLSPVAVEVNEVVVTKDRYEAHGLRAGDAVEIVAFVGGG